MVSGERSRSSVLPDMMRVSNLQPWRTVPFSAS
jgi:hypothetical protein